MRYLDHPYVNDLGDDDLAQVCVPEDAFEEALLKHAITHEMNSTPWVVGVMAADASQRLCRLKVWIAEHVGEGRFALTAATPPGVEPDGNLFAHLRGEAPMLGIRGWVQVLRNDAWGASPIQVQWGFEERAPYILPGKQSNWCPYGPVLRVRPEDVERYGWKPEAEEAE